MHPHQLRDPQWESYERFAFLGRAGAVGITAADSRQFVDAVIHRYRTGIPGRDLPEHFGDWNNTYWRWSRGVKRGAWVGILALLAVDADNEYAMLDSTIVHAHQPSAGAQKKPGKIGRLAEAEGGLSTKIHVLVDVLGNPLKIILTAGQIHDLAGADVLVPGMEAKALLTDKAYDVGKRVIEPLKQPENCGDPIEAEPNEPKNI